MLVIASDIHLTDGSTGLRMPVGAFRLFRQRLEDMAYDASKRDETTYQPIEEFDLLLLGDIFDLLRTTQWNNEQKGEAGFSRPWDKPTHPNFVKKVNDIVDAILAQNADALQVLRELAEGTAISLPPANSLGQVDRRVSRDHRSKLRLPIKVNIHYMCGNHDWIFHLPGNDFDQVRKKVVQKMGLSNPITPFPHQPEDSARIAEILQRHSVYARHGDVHDPSNYVEKQGRDYSSLGDALLMEVFNPFPKLVEDNFKTQLPPGFYADLKEMGSIRPSLMTPVWVADSLRRNLVIDPYQKTINAIWKDLVNDFLKLDFLKELDDDLFGPVDALRLLLKALAKISLDKLDDLALAAEKIVNLHAAISGGGELGFDKHATKDEAYKSGEARFIVYGHTQGFKLRPLRTYTKNNLSIDQVYLNSGTWHPLHEVGSLKSKQQNFFMYKTMSFLSFYQGSERKGRAFESWIGNLDV